MRKKSKALFFLAFILSAVLFLTQAQAGEEEEFPEWVPKEAIEAAKKGLSSFVDFSVQIGAMYINEKLKKEDLVGCTIKHPHEIVRVDGMNYIKGEKIQDTFSPLPTAKRSIGFGVYLGKKLIGLIRADKNKNNTWQATGMGYLGLNANDYLSELFAIYPPEKGFKIYKEFMGGIYFISKKGEIIKVMRHSPYQDKWISTDPIEFMVKAKKDMIEYLRLREERIKQHEH